MLFNRFFIEEADEWRYYCFKMIKESAYLNFIFFTKRIEGFVECIPDYCGNGNDNITAGCAIKN